jgi:predicted nucleotide-binding protein
MFYHVKITQKSNKSHDEVKVDLSKERLVSQFISPYENGKPIIVNGKTITSEDIERITISETQEESKNIIPRLEQEDRDSYVSVIGGPSYEWYVADGGKDITDDLIKGPPGYKKGSKSEKEEKTYDYKKIFIVHGHDHDLKNDLELFIKNIGLEPIVLHRQPDEGLTIIEKLEKQTDVEFAFVLLTPDDIGYSVKEIELKKSEEKINKELRARQNVIFEFGYLVGKLGRNRVCAIYKENVTLPTDLSGLLYKKVTESIEDIGYTLIKELKAAGYEVKI